MEAWEQAVFSIESEIPITKKAEPFGSALKQMRVEHSGDAAVAEVVVEIEKIGE